MPPPPSKIVLPTLATCRWRHAPADAPAECGLVATLLDVARAEPAAVAAETCAACCRSFPPTPRRLNPVVAGLLHGVAARVLGRPAPGDPAAVAAATRALRMAEVALDVELPGHLHLTPARDVLPCAWRGAPAGPDPTAEATHHCDHADHDLASPSRCRRCHDWARRRPISRPLTLGEIVPPPARSAGGPVREWAVGVTTAPRRRPTLGGCLDGIARAGWTAPRLFLDGTTPVPPRHAHLPTTWRDEGIGAWPAWFLALTELLVQRPDADAYLMLQDDIALHDREPLRPYLERILWPGDRPGLVVLFAPNPRAAPGWHPRADPQDLSAQALLFPPDLARALIADPAVVRSVLAASADRHTPIPDVINAWLGLQGVASWYPTPSLAQHVGVASAIWTGATLTGRRRAPWFSGGLEDAFALEQDLADFPEDDFRPAGTAAGRDDYRQQVVRGRERMQATSAVLCGVCHDVRHLLPALAARIERLAAMFRNARVVLVAAGATDRTHEFLADWQATNPRVEVLPAALGPPARAETLARCFDHVVAAYGDLDHAIIVDPRVPGGWSYDGIAHTFGADGWDFVGATPLIRGPGAALGATPWVHLDPGSARASRGRARPCGPDFSGRGGPLVPVVAGVGGLGVYRMACLHAARPGAADPEHAGFHAQLRRAGLARLFRNPSQIVLYSPA